MISAIHIITAHSGDYDEQSWWTVAAFKNIDKANACAKSLNDSCRERTETLRNAWTVYRETDKSEDMPKFVPDPREPRMEEGAAYTVETLHIADAVPSVADIMNDDPESDRR